ncbi:glycoside hydrolase family protein [Konateibacter massiliensis]|uniref:glycoside hydrolase family protein n=1 Tax=Konateibacter massiliensis TaxID=2002841 RepID=UPI000C146F0C|nr:lysozyme [Konateibacter massiliensis]
MGYKTSEKGIEFLIKEEGCKLSAYQLSGEKYFTIGVGHYGVDVYKGMTITKAQAIELLRKDLVKFEGYVNKYVTNINLNQSSFDALVSYVFNRGLGKSDGSNGLMQLIKHSSSVNDYYKNFPIYWGSATTYKAALVARRKREAELFMSEYKTSTTSTTTTTSESATKANTKIVQKWINEYINSNLSEIKSYQPTFTYTKIDDDGVFGTLSKKAMVTIVQIAINKTITDVKKKLKVDGVLGDKTKSLLPTLKLNNTGDMVKAWNGLLFVNGFNPQNFSTTFNADTATATYEYQSAKGLEKDKVVGKITWNKALA